VNEQHEDTVRHADAPLTVALEARIAPDLHGGVQQVIIGLAHGLSNLEHAGERFVFVTTENNEWLRPHVTGQCEILEVPSDMRPQWRRTLAKRLPALAAGWGAAKNRVLGTRGPSSDDAPDVTVPLSDGTVERLAADVVHFPTQAAYLTTVPSIYHPHDLQHLHLPEFFSEQAIRYRETTYRAFCEQASMVTVTTQWGRRDLIGNYGLAPEKVVVIPLAPAVQMELPLSAEDVEKRLRGLNVPDSYAYYPAQTWPHKNHLRLVDAVHHARHERGVDVSVVCSGVMNEHFDEIEQRMRDLGVTDLFHFVGYVTSADVEALYRGARLVVFPSLFEAAGGFGPVFEAFAEGVPVATSSATSLSEQAGDAALVFDPTDSQQIADCLVRLWSDGPLREELSARGKARASQYTWDRVARTFRAHYRRLGGLELSDEDLGLIVAETAF